MLRMSLVRTALERLLLLLLGAARGAFLFQGLAFGCAWVATFALAPADGPAWLRSLMLSALLLSGMFFSAGLLLVAARRWRVPLTSSGHEPAWPWPLLLRLSLLALPALATSLASGLVPLWSEIAAQLEAVGFWDGLTRNDPYGGIVLLPILLALFVPALVTAAALCSIALPLMLLPLLPSRSRLFPTLLAMGVVCQAALVLGGWLAADAFARLAEQANAAMTASGEAEVLRVAEQLRSATGVLTSTASALVAALLGMLAETDPKHALLLKVRRQAERATNIVNNLLNFSRTGDATEFTELHISRVLDDTLQLLEPQLRTAVGG